MKTINLNCCFVNILKIQTSSKILLLKTNSLRHYSNLLNCLLKLFRKLIHGNLTTFNKQHPKRTENYPFNTVIHHLSQITFSSKLFRLQIKIKVIKAMRPITLATLINFCTIEFKAKYKVKI